MSQTEFLPIKGAYRNLIVYKKAECVYDVTYMFANKFLNKGDRTIDQMVQAARSGKQNIVEGCAARTTSTETELKLLNVAKASLQELLVDYEDYLRVRKLTLWSKDDNRYIKSINVCRSNNDSEFYTNILQNSSDEIIANIAIILIHQTDFLLARLFERLKRDFVKEGGIKEQMYNARMNFLKNKK
ncbi:MAG: four helix bundle suffix domain-containing protein [Bacteroidales bacterium]|nr:four helix bundle suffix domain-containing protein [Bacteroidales bacterium]